MNRKALSIFSITAIVFASCSSSKKAAEAPEAKLPTSNLASVSIDGKADEWASIPMEYDPTGNIQYAVAHTDKELCIYMKLASPVEQTKLLHGGMQIWIDPVGKKDKTTGISYPVKGELPDDEHVRMGNGQNEEMKEARLRMVEQLISLQRFGFKPEYNGVQSIRQNTGFKAAINWDDNDNLIYEAAIPFDALPDNLKNNAIELGFFISGMDRPKNSSTSGGNWSEGQGGGGHMGGGHHSGGGGGRGFNANEGGSAARAQRQQTTSSYNQWQKVYVSENFWAQYRTK
jgi:uncharacterized membrane protein YgcG